MGVQRKNREMRLLVLIVGLVRANIRASGAVVEEGESATLKCQPSQNGQVYWHVTIDGKQKTIFAKDNENTGIKDEFMNKWSNTPATFDIVIDRAMREDNGTYTCLAILPGSNVRSQNVDLIVKVPPSVPYIDDPSDKKLILDEPGKIHCVAEDGIPTPTYTWYKCDSEDPTTCKELPTTYDARIDSTSRFPNSSFQQVTDPITNDKIIQFNQVSDGDKGYYQCVASNSAGRKTSAVTYIEATTVSMASVVGIEYRQD